MTYFFSEPAPIKGIISLLAKNNKQKNKLGSSSQDVLKNITQIKKNGFQKDLLQVAPPSAFNKMLACIYY